MKYCPHCGGDIEKFMAVSSGTAMRPIVATPGKYNQDDVWRKIQERVEATRATPAAPEALVMRALESLGLDERGKDTIVHIGFDQLGKSFCCEPALKYCMLPVDLPGSSYFFC